MGCILEIVMLVFGIITLVKGAFKLTRKKVVTGGPAYVVGVLLILPLPLALATGFAIGVMHGLQGGAPMDPELLRKAAAVEWSIIVIMLISALVVALVSAKPPQPPQDQFGPNAPYSPLDPGNPYASPGDQSRPPQY
jgi:hypothetical protein